MTVNAYLPASYQKNTVSGNLKSLWAITPAWHNLRQVIPSLQTQHALHNIKARSFKHLIAAILLFIPVVSFLIVIFLRCIGNINTKDFDKINVLTLGQNALDALDLEKKEKGLGEIRLWRSASGAILDRFGGSIDNWKRESDPAAEKMQGYNLSAAGRLFARNLRRQPTPTETRLAMMLDEAVDLQQPDGIKIAHERLDNLKKGEEFLIYGGVPGHAMIHRIECIDEGILELTTYNSGIGSWHAGREQSSTGTKILKGYHPINKKSLKMFETYQKEEFIKSSVPKVCTHLVKRNLNKKELFEFLITATENALIPSDFLTRSWPASQVEQEMNGKIKKLYEGINKLSNEGSSIPDEVHPVEWRRAQRSGFCVSRSLFAVYFHLLIQNVKVSARTSDLGNSKALNVAMEAAKNEFKKNHLKQKTTYLLAVFAKIQQSRPTKLLSVQFLNNINLAVKKYWIKRQDLLTESENMEYKSIFWNISQYIIEMKSKSHQ